MKYKRLMNLVLATVLAVSGIFCGCSSDGKERASSVPEESSRLASEQPSGVSRVDESSASSGDGSAQESSKKEESAASEEAAGSITPRMYEITDDKGHKLYTMGAIHVGDESILNMPEYFYKAFAESDAIAVERNPSNSESDDSSITKLMYPDGTKITDHVSVEDYNKVVSIVSTSPHYSDEFVYVKPMKWLALAEDVLTESVGLDPSYGVDNLLMKKAASEGKEILEVESYQSHIDLVVNMPEEIQNYLFHQIAETENYVEKNGKEQRESYESWKKGELATGNMEGYDMLSERERELLSEYYRIIRMDRNVGMAEKAEEYLTSGKTVFMAVGAAHFYGKGGIYDLMEQKGYSIRQINP